MLGIFSLPRNPTVQLQSVLRRKNKTLAILKTVRFDNINSAVIISRVSQFSSALLALMMMTSESMLSKHTVFGLFVALCFFLGYFCPIFIANCLHILKNFLQAMKLME